MKIDTENYSKVEEISLGDVNIICSTHKPKYTNNVKRVIDYGWKNQANNNKNKRRKII